MKATLNPYENAKRIINGTGGGVSPAVIEEMQSQISILGSQNETQAQDITDIKAQLTELAGAYSVTEHKTGRKWVDGNDIFEKTFYFENGVSIGSSGTTIEENTSANIITNAWVSDGVHGYAAIQGTVESNNLKAVAITGSLANIKYVTFQYTKTTQE